MIRRQLHHDTHQYSPDLRSFALTLHFFSPSAYNYVRNTFNKALPHTSTIRKWYTSINGEPGFTQESLNAIRLKSKEMKQNGKQLICGLLMDEMHIKENISYNNQRLQGYVNYGTGTNGNDGLPRATEALVFMFVAINSCWKVPIAYFLINGISSQEKSNLVNICLSNVHEAGVIAKTNF